MSDDKLLDIESKLERMHTALKRQEKELDSWRSRSVRVPNWIRNSGVALFIAIFAQSMTAIWWASEITNTQANILADVKNSGKKCLFISGEMNAIDMVGYVKRFPKFGDLDILFMGDYSEVNPDVVLRTALKEGYDCVLDNRIEWLGIFLKMLKRILNTECKVTKDITKL